MKCPNPKHKKPFDLKTERTMANGRTVTRVRICPKCKQRVETVELFKADLVAERQVATDGLKELFQEKQEYMHELREIKGTIAALVDFGRG